MQKNDLGRRLVLVLFCLAVVLFLSNAELSAQCPTPKDPCDKDGDGYMKDNGKCRNLFPSCGYYDCNDKDELVQACPSGGDGGGPGFYARIDFCDDASTLHCQKLPGSGRALSDIMTDGLSCSDTTGTFDYWATDDTGVACGNPLWVKSDISTGGRLMFRSPDGINPDEVKRWIRIYWRPTPCTQGGPIAPCPNLDELLYGHGNPMVTVPPPPVSDPCVDNVHFNMTADRLFKKGATRQEFRIGFQKRLFGTETGYSLRWDNYLFIEHPFADPDIAVLTTWDGTKHLSKAKLIANWGNSSRDDELLGCFDVKFEFVGWKGPLVSP